MTEQMLPKWFRALVVAVLLAACLTVATQLPRQTKLTAQKEQLALDVENTEKRLAKQQLEYDQALAELPLLQAELDEVAPKAAAIYETEQALRAQRKALRAEAKEVSAELAAAQAAYDAEMAALGNVEGVIAEMEGALEALREAAALLN